MTMRAWRKTLADRGRISVHVKVHANARRTDIKSVMADGTIKIDVAAVPEDGKANAALIRFFADVLDVPASHVTIVSGSSSSRKKIDVHR
jgi:uncharacterized protein (TIGR00251 family)